MGVVYRAEDTRLRRSVALKFLRSQAVAGEDDRARFVREAQSAAALDHPNICHIHEIGETAEGQLFIVMPCYEGETLGKRLMRGPLEIGEALNIASQIASALSRAHERGIVHRDLKPGNVMLAEGGRLAILMDFGLAKRADATKMTRTGTALGTVAYMSPEAASGKGIDRRADIWSLGVVLYEMLTGQQPFRGEYEPAVLYAIMSEDPEPVTSIREEVPTGVERIVERALAKDADKRYQSVSELFSELEAQRDTIELGVRQRRFIRLRRKTRGRLLRFGLPAAIVAAAALVLLVVQPFELQIHMRAKETIAQENSMVIIGFENIADPADRERYARIAKNMLITDLGESEYIRVLTEQRQYEILRELGKEEPETIDEGTAREVALRGNVNWIVRGKILSIEPLIRLTSELTHAVTGEIRSTQRTEGKTGDDLFAVVDRLTREIRSDLDLPETADPEERRALIDITTTSIDAYRFYVEGMDHLYRAYGAEAKASFLKALEYDSTFAMAYLRLGSGGIPSTSNEKKEMIGKALRYSEKATAKERMYIESAHAAFAGDREGAIKGYEAIIHRYPDEVEAYWRSGLLHAGDDPESAIGNLNRAIEIDPRYKPAYEALAVIYQNTGDIEKQIWALNELISIAPGEPNPYDTRAYLYAYGGDLDRAIESFNEALNRDPGFDISLLGLGSMYLFKEDYGRAEKYYETMTSAEDSDQRAWGRLFLASVPLYQGRLEQALAVLDRGISEDRQDGIEGHPYTWLYFVRCITHLEMKNRERAISDADAFIEACDRISAAEDVYFDDPIVILLARTGRISEAEERLSALKDRLRGSSAADMSWYWLASGWLEMEKGNIDTACVHFENATNVSQIFIFQYSLALAYLRAHRMGEAVQVFESALRKYDNVRASYALYAVKAYYYLGLAYEGSGSTGKAAGQYETFLRLWKDADPELEEVPDARRRLALLRERQP